MPTQNAKPRASPQPKLPEKGAGAPFDYDLEADLILRSSDGVHFVVKKILSLASPIFADKFSTLLPPHQKNSDVLQVVSLPNPRQSLILLYVIFIRCETPRQTRCTMQVPSPNSRKITKWKGWISWAISRTASSATLWAFMPSLLHFRHHVACGEVASALAS